MGESSSSDRAPPQAQAGYVPEEPIGIAPLFVWPPQPAAFLQWMMGFPGYLWPYFSAFIGTALVSWLYLSPDLVQARNFSVGWIALIFVRNGVLMTLVAGTFYYFLYYRRTQGTQYKYNPSWPATHSDRFLFNDQVWDNVFWNYCSALPIWVAYEVIGLWLFANHRVPMVSWSDHPVYCVLLALSIPFYENVHFWAVHRLLHWPPLYRSAHYLHHKNVNINSWSGLSMHPLEHLIFFSGAILFLIVPAHPLHLILYLQYTALATAMDHTGFHKIVLPGKRELSFDFFMHYLHHKYVEVNYAADTTFPIDKWQGTFHDGTPAGLERFKKRRRASSVRELGIQG